MYTLRTIVIERSGLMYFNVILRWRTDAELVDAVVSLISIKYSMTSHHLHYKTWNHKV